MLNTVTAMKLLELLARRRPSQPAYVALPLVGEKPPDAEQFLKEVRSLGYAAMIRTTAFGDEIVITDKVDDGDAGPTRCSPS